MNTIKLSLVSGKWVARFGGPHSYPVIRLHGTCDVELPYTSEDEPGNVAARVALDYPVSTIEVQA